jgi:hypothetical protein
MSLLASSAKKFKQAALLFLSIQSATRSNRSRVERDKYRQSDPASHANRGG